MYGIAATDFNTDMNIGIFNSNMDGLTSSEMNMQMIRIPDIHNGTWKEKDCGLYGKCILIGY